MDNVRFDAGLQDHNSVPLIKKDLKAFERQEIDNFEVTFPDGKSPCVFLHHCPQVQVRAATQN